MRIPLCDFERAVQELAVLRDRHIDNVYQCGPRTFLLKLKPGPVQLLIDLTPQRARVLATDAPPGVPQKPPVFASILRGALRGARILGVMLPARDRVVAIDVVAGGETLRLVAEALPHHGNLYLLDPDGNVVRVLDGDAAKHRRNAVGAPYRPPRPPDLEKEEQSLLPQDLGHGEFAANHFLDRLARGEQEQAEQEREKRDTRKILARFARARDGVKNDLRRLPNPQKLREQGELLLCHFGEIRQGTKKFKGIALDPKLSPPENLDRIFARARKAARAKPILQQRLADLEELMRRAEAGEPIPERAVPGRKGGRQPPRRPYKVFVSADGARILVGKGGRDNDETTLKVAGPHDLFLHVRNTPGAHVIVPLDRGQAIREQTLLDAAHLALHYSRMRNATAADVTYTPKKNVSKPKGAKPGLVSVRHEKVLRLRREPERLARLLMTAE